MRVVVAAVSGVLAVAAAGWAAGEQPTGLVVQRIWTTERMSGSTPSGEVSVSPDPGHVLMVLDVTAAGQESVSVHVDQLAAVRAGVSVVPVGAAPISPSNFGAFAGFVSGWRIVSDAQDREIRVGRDTKDQPIQLTVAPGARVSIVYIVPEAGAPLTVTLPGAGKVALVPKP